jgi:hypothetical protein
VRPPLYLDDEGNILPAPRTELTPRRVVENDGADPVDIARESIDVVAIAARLQRNALALRDESGDPPMTSQEIRAAEILLNKRMAPPAQQIDVNARVEVVEKRALLDDITALLSAPGADTSVLGRPMPSARARPAADETLARVDGRGPEGWEPDTR